MDIHATEEEQVEAIKKWVKDNGLWIVVGAAVGWGAVAGYRYIENEKVVHQQAASYTYDQLVKSATAEGNGEIDSYQSKLTTEFSDTVYADLARLQVAKVAVTNAKYDEAEKTLKAVMTAQKGFPLAHVAELRLAKVMTQQGKGEEALAMLDKASKGEFAANYHYVMGDINAFLGNQDAAGNNYKKAKELADGVLTDPMLDTKITEFAGSEAQLDIDKVIKDAE